jgi:hypothetical protein
MRPRRPRRWLAILAALLGPGVAFAAPRQELSVAAGVDSAYDQNVFNGRGPDWVNRVNPWASYRLIDKTATLDTGYELGYWTYAFGKADNSINHRAHAVLEARPLRRLVLKVGDELTRAEDPGFLNRFGVVAPQIGIIDNVAELRLGANLTRRLFAGASYVNHLARFDPYTVQMVLAGLPPLFDGMEHDADLAFQYRVLRTDDLRVAGRFQHFSAGPQDVSMTAFDLANTYSPTAGWRHQFKPELEWTAEAGPLFYQALPGANDVPGAPNTSGTTWRLGTVLRWYTPVWRAALSYSHDLVGATGAGSALWADYFYAQAGFHYLDKLDVHTGGGYFRNGLAVNQPFSYDGLTADILADWRVWDYVRLGAYYTLRWQETGPGAIPAGAPAAQFPAITRNIVGIRLLAVVGADARPPRREVHE